jgi:CRP-like cAMP-binding protein
MLSAADWATLKATTLFRDMAEADLRELVGERPARLYERAQPVFRQGEPATSFFIILDGRVKLYRLNREGEEAVVHVYGARDSFAEAAMFMGGRYPVTAEAVTTARLVALDGAGLRARVKERPEIAFVMMASMSRHLKALVDQIEQMKLMTGDERVAEFMLTLAGVRHGPVQITLPYEKTLIANRLGMKPETFSRALARLRDIGVEVTGQKVAIADTARLVRFLDRTT